MKIVKQKSGGKRATPFVGVSIGIVVCMIMSWSLGAIVALLISGEVMPIDTINSMGILIQFVSSFTGCLLAMLLTGNMPVVIASACAGGYFAISLIINVLFANGDLGGIGQGIAAIVAGAIVAIAVRLLGMGHKKKNKVRFR